MTDRDEGFYWVKFTSESRNWEVARYVGDGIWMLCGMGRPRRPEIIGERIAPPGI